MSSDTRQDILDAARDLYLKRGMAALSMRAVGSAVGLSATAIYRHFDSKDALLASLVDVAFSRFGAYLRRAASAETPEERFIASGEAYVDFALEHPDDYRLMFVMPPSAQGQALPEAVARRSRATYEMLVERVRECAGSGWLIPAKADPEALAQAIWALSHGLVSLYLAGKWAGDAAAFRRDYRAAHQLLARGYLQAAAAS